MEIAGRKGGAVRAPFRPLDENARREFAQIWTAYEKERNIDVSI
jgi:dihydrodipicolinate synthase/N-acetylneuraminate lyase